MRRLRFPLSDCCRGRWLRETGAQATVEMAIVAPVLLVLALISYNVMRFAAATSCFDRVAPDIVLAHGVAPAGEEGPASEQGESEVIRAQIERAMTGRGVEIDVSVAGEGAVEGEGILSMIGGLRTYRCTMTYVPWPGDWSIAGVSLGSPLSMTHTRKVTVDPWRSGVVM